MSAEHTQAADLKQPAGSQDSGTEALATPETDIRTDDDDSQAASPDNASASQSRAIEVPMEPDLCSICLDAFTEDDPQIGTECRHEYHLQCIMSWAQRSSYCPLCYKALQLQDEALNELLPFGEYRPPEQAMPSHVLLGLEAWELDRLLARLAVHGGGRRRNRERRHGSRSSQARAAADSPVAAPSSQDGQSAAAQQQQQASMPIAMQRDGAGNGGDDTAEQYPASWPPANHSRQYSRESAGPHDSSNNSPAADLRTRWAAVSSKAKESAGGFFSKTTKELKSLWGRPSSQGGPEGPSNGHDSPHAGSSTAT